MILTHLWAISQIYTSGFFIWKNKNKRKSDPDPEGGGGEVLAIFNCISKAKILENKRKSDPDPDPEVGGGGNSYR